MVERRNGASLTEESQERLLGKREDEKLGRGSSTDSSEDHDCVHLEAKSTADVESVGAPQELQPLPSSNLELAGKRGSMNNSADPEFLEISVSETTPLVTSTRLDNDVPHSSSCDAEIHNAKTPAETLAVQHADMPPQMSSYVELPSAGAAMNVNQAKDVEGQESEDVEAGFEPCCRICLENNDDENEDVLISPCLCKGSQKYVHKNCLNHWRSIKEGFAFSHCTTCKAQFHIKLAKQSNENWRKRKFYFLVFRDFCLIILAIQIIIILLASLIAFFCDQPSLIDDYFEGFALLLVIIGILGTFFHCSWDSQTDQIGWWGWFPALEVCGPELLIIAVIIFAFLGAIYGVIAGIAIAQRIWRRHFDVLSKKVLAEEFEVEDLQGNYTQPTLEPEIHERLTKLNLI